MEKYGNWEIIEPLGEGGQSVVYLARSPARVAQREIYLNTLKELSGQSFDNTKAAAFAMASMEYARAELPSELGALKVFKTREGGAPAKERLKREIAVLRE